MEQEASASSGTYTHLTAPSRMDAGSYGVIHIMSHWVLYGHVASAKTALRVSSAHAYAASHACAVARLPARSGRTGYSHACRLSWPLACQI